MIRQDLGAAGIGILVANQHEFVVNDRHETVRAGQNGEQISDGRQDLLVFLDDFVLLQARQAMQAQVENSLGLGLAQSVALRAQAQSRIQIVGAGLAGAGPRQHGRDRPRPPEVLHEPGLGLAGAGGTLDEVDHLVDIGQGHRQTFQDVGPAPGLAQLENSAPRHHIAAVTQEIFQQLLEVEQARLAVHQGHHIDAEHRLHIGVLEEVVEHHVRVVVALDLDDHAHAVLVRLVPELGDALDLLLLDQLRHPLQQPRLVHLVGQFGDDDGLAAAALLRLHMGAGPHDDSPPPGPIGLADTPHAIDDGGGRKVRPRDQLHEFLDPDLWPLYHRQAGLNHLAQVVRGDVGRHAHRDTGGTVDQQIGKARRQDLGLMLRLVVIG